VRTVPIRVIPKGLLISLTLSAPTAALWRPDRKFWPAASHPLGGSIGHRTESPAAPVHCRATGCRLGHVHPILARVAVPGGCHGPPQQNDHRVVDAANAASRSCLGCTLDGRVETGGPNDPRSARNSSQEANPRVRRANRTRAARARPGHSKEKPRRHSGRGR
jgi:hypothetical protein